MTLREAGPIAATVYRGDSIENSHVAHVAGSAGSWLLWAAGDRRHPLLRGLVDLRHLVGLLQRFDALRPAHKYGGLQYGGLPDPIAPPAVTTSANCGPAVWHVGDEQGVVFATRTMRRRHSRPDFLAS